MWPSFALGGRVTSAASGAWGGSGVFFPLVVEGLLLGLLVESLFTDAAPGLYPVIGLAAVLGAGYRTPLAAVMFVAETTGQAQFVIPALVATAVSQAVMGQRSVAAHQVSEREGVLGRRLRLPGRNVVSGVPIAHPAPLDNDLRTPTDAAP